MEEIIIRKLSFLCRTYDGISKLLTQTKQRLGAMVPEAVESQQANIKLLESVKGKITRQIEKELEFYPLWTQWAKHIPGVGPFIAGNLILSYYHKFVPICAECGGDLGREGAGEGDDCDDGGKFVCRKCGKAAAGGGVLTTRIEDRDFPNISKWWKFCGRHVVDGRMPKRVKGKRVDWSTRLRTVTYHLGEAFNKQGADHPYKAFLLERKKRRETTHPDVKPFRRQDMAKNEAVKLFLAHFWQVARTLEGKTVTEPYAGTIMGHTGILQPFYWDPPKAKVAKAA